MKKTILVLALLVATGSLHAQSVLRAVATPASPQSPTPSVALTWTLSATGAPPITGENVYRATCAGVVTGSVCSTDSTATFAKLAAGTNLAPTTAAFTDSTVSAGASYIYYVTAVCPATTPVPPATCQGESNPSPHAAAAVPAVATPPLPPTGLTIGAVVAQVTTTTTGTVKTVTATWKDTPGVTDRYFFSDGKQFVQEGVVVSVTGSFGQRWSGPVEMVWFTVCNVVGACYTQSV